MLQEVGGSDFVISDNDPDSYCRVTVNVILERKAEILEEFGLILA